MVKGNARKAVTVGLLAIAGFLLTGCGGNKVLKEPEALELEGPLAAESDASLVAAFDWVIVRDGPGTWSKNAVWDEYLFRVRNLSDGDITIERIVVFDSLGTLVESTFNRKQLIRASKKAAKRYKSDGLKVKAGLGGAGLAAVGGATYLGSVGVLSATGLFATGGTGVLAGAAVVGAIVVAPVLIVGGVFRGVNNSKVAAEIENRQTVMPLILRAEEEAVLDIFYPITPSPTKIEFEYSNDNGGHVLTIDTTEALDGLHLRVRQNAESPEESDQN